MTESIPEESHVELAYEGGFDHEADTYVIEASIGDVKASVTVPVQATETDIATLLAALPQVVEVMIEAVDEEIERRADAPPTRVPYVADGDPDTLPDLLNEEGDRG